jgi:Domain of unknown function (DUF4276)
MVSVRIFVEGGGDSHREHSEFRKEWTAFFKKAGLQGRMPRVVVGKGRGHTFDLFKTAMERPTPGEIAVMLVDSESSIASDHSVWQHLKDRDNWDVPVGANDGHAFLMVQVMETWFLADMPLLRSHFGDKLRTKHLPSWPELEKVGKEEVLNALRQATAGCDKPYKKGIESFRLLGKLNPNLVESKCPHAKALLDRLRTI